MDERKTAPVTQDADLTGGTEAIVQESGVTVMISGTIDYYGVDTAIGRMEPGNRIGLTFEPAAEVTTPGQAYYFYGESAGDDPDDGAKPVPYDEELQRYLLRSYPLIRGDAAASPPFIFVSWDGKETWETFKLMVKRSVILRPGPDAVSPEPEPEPEKPVKTYSYNPANITVDGVDKMRFQLGDTAVDGSADTCVMCDEEYRALISASSTWKQTKTACLEAICSRLAYEVNYSADGLSFSLSERYNRFKAMLDSTKKGLQTPIVNPAALGKGRKDGGHYFYAGMLNNPNAAGSE